MSDNERGVMFLGAGFSRCVTNGAAPLMDGFFRTLPKEKYPQLHSFITETTCSVESANLQEVVCSLDQLCDIPFRRNKSRDFLGEIQPELLLKDIGSFVIEVLSSLEWSHLHWAANALASIDEFGTVITTNYDTLAEQILSHKINITHCGPNATCFHCRMRDILLSCCSCDLEDRDGTPWRGSLLKLHGSIAWQRCINVKCRQSGCIFPDCRAIPDVTRLCEYCRTPTQPALLQPSMLKRYSEYPGMFAMWKAAELALQEAAELVIFGFSFPQTDIAIRQLFRRALCSRRLRKVHLIDLNPEAVKLSFSTLVPNGLQVEYKLLPTTPDLSVPEWWVEATASN